MNLTVTLARPGTCRPRQIGGGAVPLQVKADPSLAEAIGQQGAALGLEDGDTHRLALAAGLRMLDLLARAGVTDVGDVVAAIVGDRVAVRVKAAR